MDQTELQRNNSIARQALEDPKALAIFFVRERKFSSSGQVC